MAISADVTNGAWYYLKDYINLWFYVVDVNVVIDPTTQAGRQITFTDLPGRAWGWDLKLPVGAGITHQLAQQFPKSQGWSSEAQSQWVSHAVNPDYFKYLTRETNDGNTYYIYKLSENLRFGRTTFNNTMTHDAGIWIKDSTGKIYPTSLQVSTGRYQVPVMKGGATPGNNVRQEASSTQYGIVNGEACYQGSGWDKPKKADWEYMYYYSPAYVERSNLIASDIHISASYAEVDKITVNFIAYIPNNDPYGDDSDGSGGFGGSGGDGSRENWDDSITTPDVPSLSIGALGSMGIFTPSTTQLQSFFKYLWSDAFSVDGFKKILSDPMQAIISLHALPCAVDAGASAEVAFGNIATGVSMPRVGSEWVTVDCGSIPFKKYYGSFFDYSPYTRFQIFLPYIGYKDISPDDFVGGSCHVVYHVHVPSGALMCYLLSSAVDNSVLYQYSGSCLMQLPITSGTYNNFIGSLVTGIASGATALGNISSVAGKVASGALSAVASASSAVASLGSVLSSKPTVSRSGSISGASGWMARQVPYVIRTRPHAVLTENLNSFEGYPLYRSRMLSQMSGYTVIEDIHLSGLSATSDEAEEIERLLKEGVIF